MNNGSVWKYLTGIGMATTIAFAIMVTAKDFDGGGPFAAIFFFGGIAIAIAGVIAAGISSWRQRCHNDFVKAQGIETACVEKALDFYCNNVQLSQDRAFKKYQWYLSEIINFLIKYPKYKKFRNDLKFVFEMSQDDSRLTLKEKQEIANKFASKYKFLLPGEQAK